MPFRRLPLLLAAALAGAGAVPAAQAAPSPVFTARDLVTMPRVEDPQLSPDGHRLAYVLRTVDGNGKVHRALWVQEGTGQPRPFLAEGVSSPRWSGDGQRLYFLSSRGGSQQVWRIGTGAFGGEATAVTALPLDVESFRVAPGEDRLAFSLTVFPDCDTLACTVKRMEDRKASGSGMLHTRLFVRHWDTWADGTRSQLFVLPLSGISAASGEPLRLTRGFDGDVPTKPFGDDGDYVFAPDGRSVVFAGRVAGPGASEALSTNIDLWRVPVDGSTAPQNLTPDNPGTDTNPVFAPDGRTLYWGSMKRAGFESDRLRVMARDLSTGRTRELAPGWDRSAGSLNVSPDGRTLYLTADDVGQHRLFALDAARGGTPRPLTGPGYASALTVGKTRLVFAHDDLTHPAELYALAPGAVTPSGGGLPAPTRLTAHTDARVAPFNMAPGEQFAFAGANGETVHGYVVKPANYVQGATYPIAFIVHGGPQGSMGNHFHYRWNPQVYAGAGYAVVFIDFHGSTGYGQAFTDSISGDWGGKPLEDLKLGLKAATDRYPFLAADRAVALGASYGGFMMNWIAGNWPDRFKAIVNHDGVFDARMMAYATEELWFDEWEHGGPYYEKAAEYERFNPVNFVTRWQTPMLIVHGEKDFRIPVEQGIGAFTAAQRRGVPSELLIFPDENHWVLKPKNSIQWHDTVLAWMDRWTGNRRPEAESQTLGAGASSTPGVTAETGTAPPTGPATRPASGPGAPATSATMPAPSTGPLRDKSKPGSD